MPEPVAAPPAGNCPACEPVITCSGPQWTVPWKVFGLTGGKLAPNVLVPVFAKPVVADVTFPTPGTK
jgi:hypothetical protein